MSESDHPLVTVIMAARDTEPYIAECLDSILAQSYQHWELIAVNDHSIDRTPDILKEYASFDKRIKVLHSKREKLIPALKEGYRMRSGTLLNRMDSDDRMPHDKLEVMVREWLRHGRGTIVAGGTKHFVDEGEVGDGFLRYDAWLNDLAARSAHYEEIYQECVIPSHCWLLHYEDFDAVGGFEPEVYPEDYDLCFRYYRANYKVIGLNKILHYWRDRSERISRTWHEYKDNRYFHMKLRYFYEIDRDRTRPLVVWGAGRNGKDLMKLILFKEKEVQWVCDNEKKIGKDIYGITMAHYTRIPSFDKPQILVVVANPTERTHIKNQLFEWGRKPVRDFWFFS